MSVVDKVMVSHSSSSEDFTEVDSTVTQYIEKCADGGNKCTLCGKVEKRYLSHLKNHIETHLEGLSFPCQLCGKTFRSRNALSIHKTRYPHKTGQRKVEPMKPLKCSYSDCNEYLKSESKLRKHEDSHTNLSCPQCGKTFSRVSNRDRHMEFQHMTTVPERESHTGLRRQPKPKCPGCQKTFTDKSKLKRHMCGQRPCKMLEPESTIVLHI